MNVAEAMSSALAAEGIRIAAGITGQSIGHLADALAERQDVKIFYTRQERVAVDICDGYARVCGRPGVVFTDNGPAAANAVGGLVNSWGDSTPLLFIAGHTDRFVVPGRGTKELPFIELYRPISKWVAIVNDPSQLGAILRRAFVQLRSGRPGPVVIGLPYDVSSMPVGQFEYRPVSALPVMRSAGDPQAVRQAAKMIAEAKRPYLYVGAGVLQSEASDELVNLRRIAHATGSHHAERQERFSRGSSALAWHWRLCPRPLRNPDGDQGRTSGRRHRYGRMRVQASCHNGSGGQWHQAHSDRRRCVRAAQRIARRHSDPRRRQTGAAAIDRIGSFQMPPAAAATGCRPPRRIDARCKNDGRTSRNRCSAPTKRQSIHSASLASLPG